MANISLRVAAKGRELSSWTCKQNKESCTSVSIRLLSLMIVLLINIGQSRAARVPINILSAAMSASHKIVHVARNPPHHISEIPAGDIPSPVGLYSTFSAHCTARYTNQCEMEGADLNLLNH